MKLAEPGPPRPHSLQSRDGDVTAVASFACLEGQIGSSSESHFPFIKMNIWLLPGAFCAQPLNSRSPARQFWCLKQRREHNHGHPLPTHATKARAQAGEGGHRENRHLGFRLTCRFYRRRESGSEKQHKELASSFKFKGTWFISVGSRMAQERPSSDALPTPVRP